MTDTPASDDTWRQRGPIAGARITMPSECHLLDMLTSHVSDRIAYEDSTGDSRGLHGEGTVTIGETLTHQPINVKSPSAEYFRDVAAHCWHVADGLDGAA